MEFAGHTHAEAQKQPSDLLGQHVDGRYRIEAELGRGGMGAVYRAVDEGSGRVVALKVLSRNEPRMVALFEREYRTLSKLAHPRVIHVYNFGCTREGERYYTMELITGNDLFAYAPVPWLTACGYIRDVCTSLALLHAQRLIHRDVNPRNVRLDETGRAKLLDFGALTQFGLQDEIIGAPSCTAPEAVRGQALDGRADLFSLGVVAYLTLTGRVPFAVTDFARAQSVWETVPIAPSQLAAAVPGPLDQLVLSLLSIDPLGRPMSAADVIDRLDAITVTDDEALSSIADSHIASSPLVGRHAQQRKIAELLERVRSGRGAVLDIQGDVGAGKTRMLAELRAEAELCGLACLKWQVEPGATREQVSLALLRGLLKVAPHLTRASAALRAGPLAPLLAALGETVASEPWDSNAYSDNERMSRTEMALLALVLEIARHKPLLIYIDDAQQLQAGSAGVLSMLAQSTYGQALLLAVARLPGECAPAVQQLQWIGTDMLLEALQLSDVEQLVEATFGDAPHRTRLAQWLWSSSRGHPGQLHALLHELVAQRIVRYAGSAWLLPAEAPELLLSESLRALTARHVERLDATARTLASLLAVHHGSLPESVLLRILPAVEPRVVFDALNELVAERLTVSHDSQHKLKHESSRQLLLEQLAPEQRSALHLSLATALRARDKQAVAGVLAKDLSGTATDDILYGLAVGYHFLRGGESELGLTLLRNTSIALTVRGQGLRFAAPYLESAVEFLKQSGGGFRTYVALLPALTLAGTYVDWRLSYRYGDHLLDVLSELAGLGLARRLTPYLGGTLALYIGLVWGLLVYFLLPHKRASNKYSELLLGLMGIGSAVLGVCPILHDAVRAHRTIEVLRPLHYFPRKHPVNMVHEFQLSLFDSALGRYAQSHARGERTLAYLRSDRAKRSLPQTARFQLEAGMLTTLAQYDALRTDGSAQRRIAEIEALDSPTTAETCVAVRVSFHGHRGERALYVRALDQLDRLAAASGSTWRNDVSTARALWSTHALCEDVLSLKRLVQQLGALANELPSVARMRDFAEASYLCERGHAVDALARYEPVFQTAWNETGLRALQELGAYARVLRKAAQPERARAVCERALARVEADERSFDVFVFPLDSELSLALSALQEHVHATRLADTLVAHHSGHDNLLLRGLSHGVRAQVALAICDWTVFDRQIADMHICFQSIQHPALFAQRQRLFEQGRARRLTLSTVPVANDQGGHGLVSLDALATQLFESDASE